MRHTCWQSKVATSTRNRVPRGAGILTCSGHVLAEASFEVDVSGKG